LYRILAANEFIDPVFGRGSGRKLLFCPDAVEAWVKSRQSPANTTAITKPEVNSSEEMKAFEKYQKIVEQKLLSHAAGRKKSEH
jgi:hypothetical protein